MMNSSIASKVANKILNLTGHSNVEITTRGNTAIVAALSVFAEGDIILIPEEGGWLSYKTLLKNQGLPEIEVKCNDAVIDIIDLQDKLLKLKPSAFLYENPGGYFAEQNAEEIYRICKENHCLVIMDVSGCIGTSLCKGDYADIMVGSFGEWKLIEAHVGGFVSSNNQDLLKKMNLTKLSNTEDFEKINQKIDELPERIKYLIAIRKKVIADLSSNGISNNGISNNIIHPTHLGFVVVVAFSNKAEKEKLVSYCKENILEWTECPRYIRVNRKAISIEIKRIV